MLTGLLDADQPMCSRAPDHLRQVVHHQVTLYTATAHVAGILGDPRTLRPVDKDPHPVPGPMRAELLGWIDSVADAADNATAATGRRLGFPPEE